MEKNLLRQWREEKKVTGKQVAKAVGVSTVMISLYENFRCVPSKETAVSLVRYYFPDDDMHSMCGRVNDLLAHLRANFIGRPDYTNDKYRPSSNELPPTKKQIRYALSIAKKLNLSTKDLKTRDDYKIFIGNNVNEYKRIRDIERSKSKEAVANIAFGIAAKQIKERNAAKKVNVDTSKLLDNIYGKVSLSDFQLIEELVKLNEK